MLLSEPLSARVGMGLNWAEVSPERLAVAVATAMVPECPVSPAR